MVTLLISIISLNAQAQKYSGKVSLGSFLAREDVSDTQGTLLSNDQAMASGRLYFDVSEFSDTDLKFTTDVRDKNDFFDKLDKERQELRAKNSVQVREINLKYKNKSESLLLGSGRFSVSEAGAVFVDGAQATAKFFSDIKLGVFGGFNPKQINEPNLEFNPKAQVFGTYFSYQDMEMQNTSKYVYASSGISLFRENNNTDRFVWNENMVWHFAQNSSITTMSYLDFVPSLRLQNFYANYSQQWLASFSTSLSGLVYDVIEYQRHQGILEQLPASPYREMSLEGKYKFSQILQSKVHFSYGKRSFNNLIKNEVYAGGAYSGLAKGHLSLSSFLGIRESFTGKESFVRLGNSYVADDVELGAESEIIKQQNISQGQYASVSSLSGTIMFVDALFSTLSLQYAQDAKVRRYSGLLAINYRFGNRGVAEARDTPRSW